MYPGDALRQLFSLSNFLVFIPTFLSLCFVSMMLNSLNADADQRLISFNISDFGCTTGKFYGVLSVICLGAYTGLGKIEKH